MQLSDEFVNRTKVLLNDDWNDFVVALQQDAPTSIRLNRRKYQSELSYEKVKWNDYGYYLPQRPQFTFDPLLHGGCYYVQEASSMFIEKAIKQYVSGDVRFLDLCAAPGGKSTLVADLLSDDSLLLSNEVIRSRANILAENMAKWGHPNVFVSNNDPSQIGALHGYFDAILVDAPCSGEGMFRKDAGAIDEWSVDNVKLCKERQQRILADIWPSLKTDGVLIYSTCTYNREENEDNVRWMIEELGAEVLPVNIDEGWGISPSYDEDVACYHFFPHKTKGEGFFMAVLRKTSTESPIYQKKRKDKDKKKKEELPSEYKSYLKNKESFSFYTDREKWYALPTIIYEDLAILKLLNLVSQGICLGEFKGKDFIPDQSLALSDCFNSDAFNVCEIDWRTAISYLKRETLVLDDQPRGYLLLTYRNVPLGFVKNIGNRANNLYPNEWRIRSAYLPDSEISVLP